MRIAVTYENGEVFQHFGHSEQFKLYDVEYDPDARCDHHGHHHDGECGHDHCADHHCHGN